MTEKKDWKLQTRLAQAGRRDEVGLRAVNPPMQRGSTVLASTVAELYGDGPTYGLSGFEVHRALCEALTEIAGAAGAALVPSGLAACTVAILAFTQAGDDLLVPENVYGPTRRFCDGLLARHGVKTRYYEPRIDAEALGGLVQPNTRLLYLESPGSLTFELQDVPALAAVAKARGIVSVIDDTWSSNVLFRPFEHGVDVSIQALTKHQGGHADLLLGAVLAGEAGHQRRIERAVRDLGVGPGSAEDAALALRGLRTMPLRLERQGASGLAVARFLEDHPAVVEVLHPGLTGHPDHALFARDFAGAAGTFGFVLKRPYGPDIDGALEGLSLFGLGMSWGGYESLIIPCDPQLRRVAKRAGALIRVSIGLEDPDDLIADLAAALDRLA